MLQKNQMIVISEKETFITRVLIKKIQDTGVDCKFVPCTIDDINSNIADIELAVLYMEDGERPAEKIMHFLADTMEEKGIRLIVVAGDQQDIGYACDHMPQDIIYKTYVRPVDNTAFAANISDFYAKMASGEFKKSILIVDDDPQYLTLVREWLKEKYKVSMANSGLQAIKWLGKNKVDLILLDHEMPVTSGPQVLEMLRNDAETSSIPVMFLTGKGDKESVMAVVALKPEGYFLKNIQKDELLQKLDEYFILHKSNTP